MIALLRTYLRPYRGRIAVVLALLLIQSIGNLYLPTLNGDIINNGVAKGDNGYIISTGAWSSSIPPSAGCRCSSRSTSAAALASRCS